MSCYKILKENGFRLTPQRRRIIDLIHANGEHITAEEIIIQMQNEMPGVNKSTIYRTLETLEEFGCVFKSETDEGYIYHHADEGHHHHLVCRKCGKVQDCDEDLFSTLEQTVADKYGFEARFHHMIIKGYCRDCRKGK